MPRCRWVASLYLGGDAVAVAPFCVEPQFLDWVDGRLDRAAHRAGASPTELEKTMTEKETPAANDKDRTHNEAPSEGDTAQESASDRQHTQEAAEGDDPDRD